VAKAAASSPEAAGAAAASALDPMDLYGVRAALSDEERLVQESSVASRSTVFHRS
jgi:hypothetical protein